MHPSSPNPEHSQRSPRGGKGDVLEAGVQEAIQRSGQALQLAPKSARATAHVTTALMFAVGSHMALLGWLCQQSLPGLSPSGAEQTELIVAFSKPPARDPPSVVAPKPFIATPKPLEAAPQHLERQRRKGAAAAQPESSAGELPQRRNDPPATMLRPVAVQAVSAPLRVVRAFSPTPSRSATAALQPRAGVAAPPAGAAGARATLKPMVGETAGECVVFLFDNSTAGESRVTLLRQLVSRLESLDALQYFYVVAYDSMSRRMFSKHSPELRPLPPNRYNRKLVEQWLHRLPQGKGVAGAKWAVMHGLQMRPNHMQLFTSGEWPEAASGYLRSVNHQPRGHVRVKLHVVAATRGAEKMRAVANENGGTLELLGTGFAP